MAIATVRLCDLIAAGYPFTEKALSNYPAPSDSVRKEINEAILRNYWTREIGFQTPDEMAQKMDFAMRNIMPYYNARRAIDALDIGADPLQSYEETMETIMSGTQENSESTTGNSSDTHTTTEERTGTDKHNDATTNKSSGSSSDTNNEHGYSKHYEFPVSGGSGDGSGDSGGMDDNYAASGDSDRRSNTSEGSHSDEGSVTTVGTITRSDNGKSVAQGSGEHTETRTNKGKNGSNTNTLRKGTSEAKFRLLAAYREVIENITMMIVKDPAIEQLFYGNFS